MTICIYIVNADELGKFLHNIDKSRYTYNLKTYDDLVEVEVKEI